MSPSLQDIATPLDALPPESQEELSRILEDYLADLERGVRRDPTELIAAHPDLAEPLKLYLDSLDFLHKAAVDLGGESATPPADGWQHKELGDFKIEREIGRGGMGIVYAAEQMSIRRQVALKVLPFAAVLDQKQIARFNNEAQAAGQLNHPHIVPVYSVGCERGVHYYSMQLIEGQSLDLAIEELRIWAGEVTADEIQSVASTKSRLTSEAQGAKRGRESSSAQSLPSSEYPPAAIHSPASPTDEGFSTARSVKNRGHIRTATQLAIEAAEAIHHAHEYGIVHRDIKPSNLLIDRQGKLWITDFGLARCQAGNNLTMTGDLLGTARYMSPEQAAGRGELVDHRTDIYSLGVTLYELLTLHHPFRASDRQALLRQIEHDEATPPRRVNSAIPIDLETIVLKAISKSRDERYESAQDMADDLHRFLDGKPTLATRPTLLDRTAKWAGRHRSLVATVIGVLLFALCGTITAALLIAAEKDRTEQALAASKENLAQSQANLHQAIDVVDRFGMRLANQLAEVPGMESLRRSVLEETLRDYEGFVEQLQHDPGMRFALALSHSHMGTMREQLGHTGPSLDAYAKAHELYAQLANEQPDVPRFRHDLAICHNNVGDIFFQKGDILRAKAEYDQALTIQRSLVAADSAEDEYQCVLAATLVNLGNLQRATQQIEQALQTYDEAMVLQQGLVERHPDDERFQRDLAVSYVQLSFLHAAQDLARAEHYNSQALTIQKRLVDADPTGLKPLSDLATCYNHRGSIYSKSRHAAEAIAAFEAATLVQERLVQRAPTIVHYQEELAVSHNNLGQMFVASSQDKARTHFERAKELLSELVEASPGSPRYQAQLGGVLANLGPLYEADRPAEARTAYEQAIQHQTWAVERAPQMIDFRIWLSSSYVKYGRFLRQQSEPGEAAEIALRRRELWKGIGTRLHRVAIELAQAATMLANTDSEQSRRWADEAVATLEQAVAAGFEDRDELSRNDSFQVLADHPRFRTLLAALGEPTTDEPGNMP